MQTLFEHCLKDGGRKEGNQAEKEGGRGEEQMSREKRTHTHGRQLSRHHPRSSVAPHATTSVGNGDFLPYRGNNRLKPVKKILPVNFGKMQILI